MHYVLKVSILWSVQRRPLSLCIHNIYTQYMYKRAVYTYINVCMYVCAPALEGTAPTVLMVCL